ncbi:DUF3962 domain-containing protein [Streptomyces sp. NPDC126497]|uniref:pPIWI_RE module domain-containing protein n=1 Tax=Streptomyces sp. NPDC126497 TaxID=3155313 RepID=UPI00332BFE32
MKEADHWIHGRDGIRIAIGHQAAMGRHPIGTGLMPSERRRLIEWAEQAIAPEFVPAPKLERSPYARPPPRSGSRRCLPSPSTRRLSRTQGCVPPRHGRTACARPGSDWCRSTRSATRSSRRT